MKLEWDYDTNILAYVLQEETRRHSTLYKKQLDTGDQQLMDSIIGEKTSSLWRKSANCLTLKFNDPILEAKVEVIECYGMSLCTHTKGRIVQLYSSAI